LACGQDGSETLFQKTLNLAGSGNYADEAKANVAVPRANEKKPARLLRVMPVGSCLSALYNPYNFFIDEKLLECMVSSISTGVSRSDLQTYLRERFGMPGKASVVERQLPASTSVWQLGLPPSGCGNPIAFTMNINVKRNGAGLAMRYPTTY